MKNALISMVLMFICIVPLGGVWSMIFSYMVGGGIEQSFLYPIYGGIILLTGVIVGTTTLVINELNAMKKEFDNIKK